MAPLGSHDIHDHRLHNGAAAGAAPSAAGGCTTTSSP